MRKTSRELLLNDLERLSQLLSMRYDIRVVFEGDRCETNGKTIYLPSFSLGDDSEEARELIGVLQGMLDHEAAHIRYTDWSALRGIKTAAVKAWTNVVEDARIEMRWERDWRGSRENFANVRAWVLSRKEDNWEKASLGEKLFFVSLFVSRGDLDRLLALEDIEDLLERIEPILPGLRRSRFLPSTWHAVAVGIWLAKMTGFDTSLDEASFEELSGSSFTSFVEEAFDTEDVGVGDVHLPVDEGGLDVSGIDDSVDGRLSSVERGGDVSVEVSSEVPDSHADLVGVIDGLDDDEGGGVGRFLDVASMVRREVRYLRESEVRDVDYYVPYSTAGDVVLSLPDGDRAWFLSEVNRLRKYSGVAVRRLRMALVARGKSRVEYDKLDGELHTAALPRLVTEGYPRIFKRRVFGEAINARIMLVVDESGSMYSRIGHARDAAIVFGDFCDQVGVPFEILGFTTRTSSSGKEKWEKATSEERDTFTRWDDLVTHVYKEFGERWRRVGHRLMHMKARSENVDGESIMIAARRLLRAHSHSSERLILMVFSDGYPSQPLYQYHECHRRHLRNTVDRIYKMGIECVGIGIQTPSVKEFYPDYVEISSCSDLVGAQLNKLRDILLRGRSRLRSRLVA